MPPQQATGSPASSTRPASKPAGKWQRDSSLCAGSEHDTHTNTRVARATRTAAPPPATPPAHKGIKQEKRHKKGAQHHPGRTREPAANRDTSHQSGMAPGGAASAMDHRPGHSSSQVPIGLSRRMSSAYGWAAGGNMARRPAAGGCVLPHVLPDVVLALLDVLLDVLLGVLLGLFVLCVVL